MEVRYVNYAIANNFGDYVELHEGLKAYPQLHDYILKHELEHTNKEGFTKDDFMHDIAQQQYSWKDMLKFLVNNPSALIQLLPAYKKGDTVYYDINMILIWTGIIVSIGIALYFGLNI